MGETDVLGRSKIGEIVMELGRIDNRRGLMWAVWSPQASIRSFQAADDFDKFARNYARDTPADDNHVLRRGALWALALSLGRRGQGGCLAHPARGCSSCNRNRIVGAGWTQAGRPDRQRRTRSRLASSGSAAKGGRRPMSTLGRAAAILRHRPPPWRRWPLVASKGRARCD